MDSTVSLRANSEQLLRSIVCGRRTPRQRGDNCPRRPVCWMGLSGQRNPSSAGSMGFAHSASKTRVNALTGSTHPASCAAAIWRCARSRHHSITPRQARQRAIVRSGKVDACYKSLILPNFDAKWTGQEFAGLFDRSFITVSMNCVTAIDVS